MGFSGLSMRNHERSTEDMGVRLTAVCPAESVLVELCVNAMTGSLNVVVLVLAAVVAANDK